MKFQKYALSYIVYSVHPYCGNISKRLTKIHKIYFCDTGLLCYLLSLDSKKALESHQLYGAIFENLAMGELLKSRLNMRRTGHFVFPVALRTGSRCLGPVRRGVMIFMKLNQVKTLRRDYTANIDWLAERLDNAGRKIIIYDGESLPPKQLISATSDCQS